MIKKKTFILEDVNHLPIIGDLTFKTSYASKLVIFCHGYKGFKDWGCWNLVANKFANNGIKFLKFNFSHNGGTIENPIDFPDLEAFSKNNYSFELNDVSRIIDFLTNKKDTLFQFNELNIIGHSRGGGIATLAANKHSLNKLITWASVSDFGERFPVENDLLIWRKNGIRFVENNRTKQMMPHLYQFYEDFIDNKRKLNIKNSIQNFEGKSLICHGSLDQAVNISNAHNLVNWGKDSSFIKIRSNHTFGARHPWNDEQLPVELNQICNETISFLNKE